MSEARAWFRFSSRDDWRIVERTTLRNGKPTEGRSHRACLP
jgi:hypothetical protein